MIKYTIIFPLLLIAIGNTLNAAPQTTQINAKAFENLAHYLQIAVTDQQAALVGSILDELTRYNFRVAITEGIPESSDSEKLIKVDISIPITDALDKMQAKYKIFFETHVIKDRKKVYKTADNINTLLEKAYKKVIFDSL